MRFGQRNQPIQTLRENRADDTLADGIGHRTSRWRFQHRNSEPSNRFIKVLGKDVVAIVQQVFVAPFEPDSLAQLLKCPGRIRVAKDVAMNQRAATRVRWQTPVAAPSRK